MLFRTRRNAIGFGLVSLLAWFAVVNDVAACTPYWDTLGYSVDSFSYAYDPSGTAQVSVSGVRYLYPEQRFNWCNAAGMTGSDLYTTRPALLELWAFPSPYQSGATGYQLLVSPLLHLSMVDGFTPGDDQPPIFISYGGGYTTAPSAPLATLPPGTWWMTGFLLDAGTQQSIGYQNFSQPVVVASASPPPPPPAPSITPQIGLWWNPNESGSGYALDFKHGVLVVTIYSYQSNGNPQWYLAAGPLNGNVFSATLNKYGSGQCISCAYQPPSQLGDDGSITITFASPASATVQLPGGRVTTIQPQAF